MKKLKNYGRAALGVIILILIVVTIFVLVKAVSAEPIDTYHSSWHLVRETANEDGDTFAAVYDITGVGTTDGDFASKNTSTVLAGGAFCIKSFGSNLGPHEGFSPGGAWMFAICGSNFDDVDDTFSFNIIGWSKTNGMLQMIAEGDGVLGTQAVGTYPDGGTAHGGIVNSTAAVYTHSDTTFTLTDQLDDVTTGMMARVTGAGFTNAILKITTVTSNDSFICSSISSSSDCTATAQINPAFWADTINLDETTKWPSVAVYNSGDNEMAFILIDTTGLEWIQFVISKAAAGSGEAGNMTVYGRRY